MPCPALVEALLCAYVIGLVNFFLLSLVLVLVIVNLSLNNVLPNDVGAWLSKSWMYVYRMGNIVV